MEMVSIQDISRILQPTKTQLTALTLTATALLSIPHHRRLMDREDLPTLRLRLATTLLLNLQPKISILNQRQYPYMTHLPRTSPF